MRYSLWLVVIGGTLVWGNLLLLFWQCFQLTIHRTRGEEVQEHLLTTALMELLQPNSTATINATLETKQIRGNNSSGRGDDN